MCAVWQNFNMKIIPAVIPKNQKDLVDHALQVAGSVSYVQIDVCDGVFVQAKTAFTELPFLEETEYELDLMIDQPERVLGSYIDLQPARIIIHLESVKDFVKLFFALEHVRDIIEVGFAISNDTDDTLLNAFIEDCDFVQVMGIVQIGSQGQPFDERCLERISYLRRNHPLLPISVDGAVGPDTIRRLADAGATRFVSGSAVFGSGNAKDNVAKLESLLQ